ncbi:MAG: S1 RNA-binding domain-containing protein, partial [Bacteroidota bacterium]
CACQMDIKIDGLPYEQLEKALEQARVGRIHILNEMADSISTSREDLKPHAPRIVELTIDKSFIGAVIGPGGKVIQDIQATTSTVINIEEDGDIGRVSISSNNKESIDAAVARINQITFTPQVGDVYEAKVASVMPYGVFVDFQGKSGLLHVSEMSWSRINDVSEVFKEGDAVKVKLIEVDRKTGKLRLSRKALMERPEGVEDRGDRRGGGRDRDRRSGGRDRRDRR